MSILVVIYFLDQYSGQQVLYKNQNVNANPIYARNGKRGKAGKREDFLSLIFIGAENLIIYPVLQFFVYLPVRK